MTALRKAIVRLATGLGELPASDTLCPQWTGTAVVPVGSIAVGTLSTATATMASTTGSGTLANGTPVSVGVKGLPVGLQAMNGTVTADNTVTVFLRANVLVTIAAATTITITAVQPR